MQIAVDQSNTRIVAKPNMSAFCSVCGDEVTSKCGKLNIWHWAHKSKNCDPWTEPETEWHKGWKENFPSEQREVVLGNHRADIYTKNNIVIEFQHSSISIDEIHEREDFYGERMIWVVDGREFASRFFDSWGGYFIWRHAREVWTMTKRPVFFDFGDKGLPLKETLSDGKWKVDTWSHNSALYYAKEFFLFPYYRDGECEGFGDKVAGLGMLVSKQKFLKKYSVKTPK